MKCIDEITLNAYFDGELSPNEMKQAATHLAACRNCTQAAQDIEDEIATLSLALEAEITRPVPTERLWARIETAVAELPPPLATRPAWGARLRQWFSGLNFALQPALALATVVIVSVSVAWFAWDGSQSPTAASVGALANNSTEFPVPVLPAAKPQPTPEVVPASPQPRLVPVKFTPPTPTRPVETRKNSPVAATPKTEPALLQDEESYLKSIASLEKALAAQQSEIDLQPGLRAAYERNVAVLDQAIKSSQRTARRNPKDADAADFLYFSYQSKLDLMTTVAAQTRSLIAGR